MTIENIAVYRRADLNKSGEKKEIGKLRPTDLSSSTTTYLANPFVIFVDENGDSIMLKNRYGHEAKPKPSPIAIYRFSKDFGRMGDLEGVFSAYKEDVAKLIDSGREVYFGEVLGKHSEVVCSIDAEDIEMISDETNIVKFFDKLNISNGYNPFDYIQDGEDDDE